MTSELLIEVDGQDGAAADAQLHRAQEIVEERQAHLRASGLNRLPDTSDYSLVPTVIFRVRAEKKLTPSMMAQLHFVVQNGRAVRVVVIFPEANPVSAAAARDARRAAGIPHSGLTHC